MSKIDIPQLVKEIRGLERHQVLWKVLKGELEKRGYWKNKNRRKRIGIKGDEYAQ